MPYLTTAAPGTQCGGAVGTRAASENPLRNPHRAPKSRLRLLRPGLRAVVRPALLLRQIAVVDLERQDAHGGGAEAAATRAEPPGLRIPTAEVGAVLAVLLANQP